MNVIKTALSFLPENSATVIVTYDMSIEESKYDSQMGTLIFGTQLCGEEWKNTAIVAEEVAHAYQDSESYWAMRLCQWRILPGIFQFFVERDAKKRALEIVEEKSDLFDKQYLLRSKLRMYYEDTLKEYRKKSFGI